MTRRGRIGPGRGRNGKGIETGGDLVLLGLSGVGAGAAVGAEDEGVAAALGTSDVGVGAVVRQSEAGAEERERILVGAGMEAVLPPHAPTPVPVLGTGCRT